MASVSLNHIYKVYAGGVTAVTDFNLEIKDKEFIILVGPSGCGKSTTLRMIAGLEEISDGELYIGDKLVNDVAPKDRDIAMVFQNYALYPHMTVFDNMAFGLKLRKTPKDEIKRRVEEAARILDIAHLLDRKPKALSGGQRQRVALGRAIVREPKVFLLDEPLSNLDAKLRAQMRTELSKLHKKLGTTFIYVTHDQTEAMTMADRIVVMKDGFIQQVDTPQNLYDYPCNLFVAGFIGSSADELLQRKAEQGRPGCASLPSATIRSWCSGLARFPSVIDRRATSARKSSWVSVPRTSTMSPRSSAARPTPAIDVERRSDRADGFGTYLYLKTTGKERQLHRPCGSSYLSARAGEHHQDCFRREPSALLRQGNRKDHYVSLSFPAMTRALPTGGALFYEKSKQEKEMAGMNDRRCRVICSNSLAGAIMEG